MTSPPTETVLFDATCPLCTGSVQWILRHERAPVLHFAPLNSAAAERLLAARQLQRDELPDSIVLLDAAGVHVTSAAMLRIARHLRAPWRWVRIVRFVPRALRDALYRQIARHRRRLFGTHEGSFTPPEGASARFLGP